MAKVFDLISPNYRTLAAQQSGSDKEAGAFGTVEDTYVFSLVDVPDGNSYAGVYYAEIVKAGKAAVAIAAGEKLYYDVSESVVTNVATDNLYCGVCVKSALAADSHVNMEFDGQRR